MRVLLLFPILMLIFKDISGQVALDTLHTTQKKIVCRVKEIGREEIGYSNPDSEVLYRIPKQQVQSITFGSGRKENITSNKYYFSVASSKDWSVVDVTFNPEEIESMVRLGYISTKAKGSTIFSSFYNTQNPAMKRLKQTAALLGGNVILVTDQSLQNGIFSQPIVRGYLSGIVYRTQPFDTTGVTKNLATKRFQLIERNSIGLRSKKIKDGSIEKTQVVQFGKIIDAEVINGIPILQLKIGEPAPSLILVSHSSNHFTVVYQHKKKFIELRFQESPLK